MNLKYFFMKPGSRLTVAKTLLVLFCFALFSFASKWGGDSFEIWLNGKMVLQQFVHVSKGVQTLQLSQTSENEKLDIYYRHCGQTGSNRYITIKDENGRPLKVWKFSDSNAAMSFRLKEILGLKKNKDSRLSLFYSSKQLPAGRLLATLNTSKENSIASK